MTMDSIDTSSTRPYLIRAIYEWCTDNGLTPFIAVLVDHSVQVPLEYVKDGEIVLNISFDATSALRMGNDCIEFKGRFGGVARDIYVPVGRVVAIYARENGQGMAFPIQAHPTEAVQPPKSTVLSSVPDVADAPSGTEPHKVGTGAKPSLTRVK